LKGGGDVASKKKKVDKKLWIAVACMGGLLVGLLLISCLTMRRETDYFAPEDMKEVPVVRVALLKGAQNAKLGIRGEYEIFGVAGEEHLLQGADLSESEIRPRPDGIEFGGYLFAVPAMDIVPKERAALRVNGIGYRGSMRVEKSQRGLVLINRVRLEEYIAGVIGNEMPLAWPDEALKAQAIAARSYAIYRMRVMEKKGYDLGADASSQVYRGLLRETAKARRIIHETRGIILTYRWKLFSTYYHSTCGGWTCSAAEVFGARDIAPLSGVRCGFCMSSKYYRWSFRIGLRELENRLKKKGYAFQDIRTVEALRPPHRRLVKALKIVHRDGTVTVPANRFRLAVGPQKVRSMVFTLKQSGKELLFEGEGWGHSVGLCQVGAKGMAQAGYDAVHILKHYYPGSELVKLYD
jgi:stage II sporulation protein D